MNDSFVDTVSSKNVFGDNHTVVTVMLKKTTSVSPNSVGISLGILFSRPTQNPTW